MDTITVLIGRIESTASGIVQDRTRMVRFVAEKIAEYIELGPGREGGITDTRGMTSTLYRTKDGKLVVSMCDWSHWEGEPTVYRLREVSEADLQPTGRFAALGERAGFGRPLTLEEALALGDEPVTCEACDAELPNGGSPFWLDANKEVYLCTACAGQEDAIA